MNDDRAGTEPAVTEAEQAEPTSEPESVGGAGDQPADAASTAGWNVQARIFGAIAAFIGVIGTVYWFVSYENAGTVFLGLTAVMATITGAYVAFPRKAVPDTGDHEPGHDPHDGVWFPEASIWPIAIGAGMVLVANGLLLGIWLFIPAVIFLAWALAGMIRQGRRRI